MEINCPFVEKILTKFIKDELSKFGFKRGILGLSGGLDSTVCAFLCVKALTPKNVIGLILPYRHTFDQEVKDAERAAGLLKIQWKTIDITPMVDAYFSEHPTEDRVLKGNKIARERMSILYDFSGREKALIIGTSNKTELLLGYGTVHGDLACAIMPLGDLYKTQVRELSTHLRIPENIQKKVPTAGLWEGQTDEGELGLTYAEADTILFRLVDQRQSKQEVIRQGFKRETVERIINLIKKSEFKRKMPLIPKISHRSVGHDFLYPYDWDK